MNPTTEPADGIFFCQCCSMLSLPSFEESLIELVRLKKAQPQSPFSQTSVIYIQAVCETS